MLEGLPGLGKTELIKALSKLLGLSFRRVQFTPDLLPGDIICTGTPPGVGLGIKPNPVFLKPGDVMTLKISGLGEQKQKVVAYSA